MFMRKRFVVFLFMMLYIDSVVGKEIEYKVLKDINLFQIPKEEDRKFILAKNQSELNALIGDYLDTSKIQLNKNECVVVIINGIIYHELIDFSYSEEKQKYMIYYKDTKLSVSHDNAEKGMKFAKISVVRFTNIVPEIDFEVTFVD